MLRLQNGNNRPTKRDPRLRESSEASLPRARLPASERCSSYSRAARTNVKWQRRAYGRRSPRAGAIASTGIRRRAGSAAVGDDGRDRDGKTTHWQHRCAGDEARAEQGPGNVERRVAARGAEADQGRGRRARPLLVHRPRGAPEVVRDHARRDGGRPRRRHGLRRLVDHRLQPDRGVGHGRDPRPRDVRDHAAARRRPRPCARLQGRRG